MQQLAGTAFLWLQDPSDLNCPNYAAVFLVTAQHVIDRIAEHGGRGVVRLSTRAGVSGTTLMQVAFTLYLNHPHEEAVDIVVAPVTIPPDLEYQTILTKTFATQEVITEYAIGVGEEVFVSGLFWNHYGKERNLPNCQNRKHCGDAGGARRNSVRKHRSVLSYWHVHDLRREFASRLLELSADLHDVQMFLGHAVIATTSRYLQSTPVRLARALARLEGDERTASPKGHDDVTNVPAGPVN